MYKKHLFIAIIGILLIGERGIGMRDIWTYPNHVKIKGTTEHYSISQYLQGFTGEPYHKSTLCLNPEVNEITQAFKSFFQGACRMQDTVSRISSGERV
jgi:hypothetical protein